MTTAPAPAAPRRAIQISASQIESWRACHRKWWLEKVAKAARRDKGYFDFGTVLHAVIERWMKADARGVDLMTGHPVELYPPGWEIAEDTGVAIPAEQQALIRKLVDAAIAEGTLRRQPGQLIEENFTRQMGEVDGTPVFVTGIIDVLHPGAPEPGVEDHKSTSSWRYAKTAKQLQTNPQLLLYVGELMFRLLESGADVPEQFLVRHNVFGKDPDKPRVRPTEAWVSREAVLANWAECLADAEKMLEVREVKVWSDVPGPQPGTDACRAFGGCDFQRLCSGEKTLDEVNKLNTSLSGGRLAAALANTTHERIENMAVDTLTLLMQKRAAALGKVVSAAGPPPEMNSGVAAEPAAAAPPPAAAKPAAAAPPPAAAKPAAAAAPPAAAAAAAEKRTAPWYDEGCVSCSTNTVRGFSTKGSPCRICNHTRSKLKLETSDAYDIIPGASPGAVTWKRRDGAPMPEGAAAGATVGSTAAPVVEEPRPAAPAAPVERVVATPPAAAAPAPATRAPAAPAVVADATQGTKAPDVPTKTEDVDFEGSDTEAQETEAPAGATGRGRGRPKVGFTLMVGCRPGKGFMGTRIVFLSEVLAAHIKVIEQHPKFGGSATAPKDFWSLNAFDRRDALVQQAGTIADALGTAVLVVDSDLIESRNLLDALRAFPCREIVGTAAR